MRGEIRNLFQSISGRKRQNQERRDSEEPYEETQTGPKSLGEQRIQKISEYAENRCEDRPGKDGLGIKYDGKYVLRTNTKLTNREVAQSYKLLWKVERAFQGTEERTRSSSHIPLHRHEGEGTHNDLFPCTGNGDCLMQKAERDWKYFLLRRNTRRLDRDKSS